MKSPILLGILFPLAVLAVALPLVTLNDRNNAAVPATTSMTGATTTATPPPAPEVPAATTSSPETPVKSTASADQSEATSSSAQTINAQYADQMRGVIDQAASGAYTTDASYAIGSIPQDTPALAEGEHVELVRSNCAVCHSTTHITSQPPLSGDTWRSVVYKMKESYGATFISDENADKIVDYLSANYASETRPVPSGQDGG